MKFNSLLFGTAGIPNSTQGDTIQGIKDVKKLGLDAMEMEFVRQVHVKKEKAPEIMRVAKESNVALTCHGPYWINLNSTDKVKAKKSMGYVLDSARITHACGGWSACFHAAFYMGMEKEQTYQNIRGRLKEVVSSLKDEGVNVWIRPEFAGKVSQWGGIEELVRISQDVEMVQPCIDFAHIYARSIGAVNNYSGFAEALELMEKGLGRESLNNMHIHMQGIAFGKAGEKKHQNIANSAINYRDVLKAWKDFKIRGIVIAESPNIEKDAMFLKKAYNSL